MLAEVVMLLACIQYAPNLNFGWFTSYDKRLWFSLVSVGIIVKW